jgi:hypothetical protein
VNIPSGAALLPTTGSIPKSCLMSPSDKHRASP